ncbi:MAG: hypothetical protein R2911_07630 [Caldilineaceae bacterium]
MPRLYTLLQPIVDEAVQLSTSWERKLALLDQMADVLDQAHGGRRPHLRPIRPS